MTPFASRQPSIVHLTTFLQGGAGRAITDLACAQHARGWEVMVVSSPTGEGAYGNYPHYLERLRSHGVPVLLEDSLFKRDAALNQRVVDRLLSVTNPDTVDIVHAHAATPARAGLQFAAHGTQIPAVIQTQHGWGTNKTPQQTQDDFAILQQVARVVVTSPATAAFLELHGINAQHIATIPCGLPAATPELPQDDIRRRIEQLRRKQHRIVGCVGTVTDNKNQHAVIEALEYLALDKVTVVFVGEGSEALGDMARALGMQDRVMAIGYRPEADRLMPLFDLLVVPSRTEGQGLVVLEAFRANVPVLASDIPAFRPIVLQNRTGWRFSLDNPQALAEAIQRCLLTSPGERTRITGAAWRTFQHNFTADVMVERHEALYMSLIRRSSLHLVLSNLRATS